MRNKIFVFNCKHHETHFNIKLKAIGGPEKNMKNDKHPNPTDKTCLKTYFS